MDNLSRDLLIQMWEAGYITLFMGVESADQQVLDQVDKKTTISKIKDAFEIARKEKMRTIVSVVLGMPGNTKESTRRTIKLCRN